MASIIKLKRSSSAGSIPGSLELGEIAVNLFDRRLYVGNTTGVTAVGGEEFRLTVDEGTNSGDGAYIKLLGETVPSTNSVLLQAGEGIDITLQGNGSILFAGEDASDTNKGVASFSATDFKVTSGAVELADTLAVGNTGITGTLDVSGLASLDGGIDVDSAFTVADSTGNIDTTGTLNVDGSTSLNALTATTFTANSDATVSGQLNVGENVVVTGNTSVGGDLQVTGDTSIDGNLTVEGAITYISSSTVNVDDSMLKLAANNAGDTVDTGIYAAIYNTGNTSFTYSGYYRDATDGIFKFYTDLDVEPTQTVDNGDSNYTLAQVDAIIDGGTY